jgi:hypothetical protein
MRKLDTDRHAPRESVLARKELAPKGVPSWMEHFLRKAGLCFNESLAILFAQTTGLRLQTERQCCRFDEGLLASSRILPRGPIPPLWGFGGDGACAVATEKDLEDVAPQTSQQDKGLAP